MVKKSFPRVFGVALFLVLLVGVSGSLVSYDQTWYDEGKSSLTPPDYVFGIVWTVLYLLIAISLALAWIHSSKKQKSNIAWAYGLNLVANALWTHLFFGLQQPLVAFIDLLFILGTIVWMMVLAYRIDKRACWLLVPYLLWVSFASILNAAFVW